MKKIWIFLLLAIFVVTGFVFVGEGKEQEKVPPIEQPPFALNTNNKTAYGVASDSPIATKVGMDILKNGGNAVDAAIAVSYALGVAEPYGSGIGGGGTMLVHPGEGKDPVVYDYREVMPKRLPDSGVGIPGFVKGMDEVHDDFGKLKMASLIQPSIDHATNGVSTSRTLHNRLRGAAYRLPNIDHFFPNGQALSEGELLVQNDLAETLKSIQVNGPDVFYEGYIAEDVADEVNRIRLKDMENYEVVVKEPLKGRFYDYDILTSPAPSGGLMLTQTLEMAELAQVEKTQNRPADFAALMGMINRRSYKDRLEHIGDPAFVDVPVKRMLAEGHLENLIQDINPQRLSDKYRMELDTEADLQNHSNTTHIVVKDKNGMMVSATNTLSNFFGSGEFVNGFWLNNQLKNFSSSEDSPNLPEQGKRPYSYTAPTIMAQDGKPVLGIGSSGGRRIPSMVAQTLIKTLVFNQHPQNAINSPRSFLEVHEDVLNIETYNTDLMSPLINRGFDVNQSGSIYFGSVQMLMAEDRKSIKGASDRRRGGNWGWNLGS